MDQAQEAEQVSETHTYAVGDLVNVERRAWPGINKPGGVGRVVRTTESTNDDGNNRQIVSVRYVLDGTTENGVDVEYVQPHEQSQFRSLRDRSNFLGRCSKCGSLRKDCGSCDWNQNLVDTGTSRRARITRRSKEPSSNIENNGEPNEPLKKNTNEPLTKHATESSDEEDNIDAELRGIRSCQRRGKSFLARLQKSISKSRAIEDNSDEDSDDSNESEQNGDQSKDGTSNGISSNASDQNGNNGANTDKKHRYDSLTRLLLQESSSDSSDSSDDSTYLADLATERRRLRTTRVRGSILECLDARSDNHHGASSPKPLRRVSSPVARSPNQAKQNPNHLDASPSQNSLFSRDTQDSDGGDTFPIQDENSASHESHEEAQGESVEFQEDPTAQADGGFIQPEGTGEDAPDDVPDKTKHIPHGELPSFFDKTASDLESKSIPLARTTMMKQQRSLKKQQQGKDRGGERNLDEKIVEIKTALRKAEAAYEEQLITLVRCGVDQCRFALHRIGKRSLLKKFASHISSEQRAEFSTSKRDLREMRFDQLYDQIEDLLKEFRRLLEEFEDFLDEMQQEQVSEDDGWTQPEDMDSPERKPSSPSENLYGQERTLGAFDPHQHAHTKRISFEVKKRRKRLSSTSRKKVCKQVTRRTSSDHGEPEPTERTGEDFVDENGFEALADGLEEETTSGKANHHQSPSLNASGNHLSSSSSRRHKPRVSLESPADLEETQNLDGEHSRLPFNGIRRQRTRRERQTRGVSLKEIQGTTERTAPDRESARSRMERFLQANAEHLETGPASPSSKENAGPRVRRRKTKRRRSSETQREADEAGSLSNSGLQSPDVFFRILRSKANLRESERTPVTEDTSLGGTDIQRICADILTYPGGACSIALDRLGKIMATYPASLDQDAIIATSTTLLETARRHGRFLLQELLARAELSRFSLHAKLLVTALDFIFFLRGREMPADIELQFLSPESDGFLRSVFHQTVETCLSFCLPNAWGLNLDPTKWSRIMTSIRSLLESLSWHRSLVEETSKCILKELPCQQWRIGDKKNAFLSCCDPEHWASVLDSRIFQLAQSPCRYEHILKGNPALPRVEVKAIWSVLALVASCDQKGIEINGSFTWDLISSMFVHGTLPRTEPGLFISPLQVRECEKELIHLVDLVSSGAFDCLRLKDSFLVNVMDRALKLGAQEERKAKSNILGLDTNQKEIDYYIALAGKVKKSSVFDRHNKKGTQNENGTIDAGLVQLRHVVDEGLDESRLFLPSSQMARHCLALWYCWIRQLPRKKVRIKNFIKQAKVKITDKLSQTSSNSDVSDPFQQAFGAAVQSDPNIEFKAFFEILSCIGLHSHSVRLGSNNQQNETSKLSRAILGMFANDGMNDRASALRNKTQNPQQYFRGDTNLVQVKGRVVSALLFCFCGVNPFLATSDAEIKKWAFQPGCNDRVDEAEELVAHLLCCLECASYNMENLGPFCFVGSCIQSLVVSLGQLCSSSLATDEQRLLADKIMCLFWDLFPPIFQLCFRTLIQVEVCGPLLKSGLTILLCILRCLRRSPSKTVPPTAEEDSQTDLWGGLDDELFLQISDAQLRGTTESGTTSCTLTYQHDSVAAATSGTVAKQLIDAMKTTRDFSIQRAGRNAVTSQGKALVRASAFLISECLAKVSLFCEDKQTSDMIVNYLLTPENGAETEKRHTKRFVNTFLATLFLLDPARSQDFSHLVHHIEQFSLQLAAMSLDSRIFGKLPSFEMASSLRERDRHVSTEKIEECRIYHRLRANKLPELKNGVRQFWNACRGLWDRQNSGAGNGTVPTAFHALDSDLNSEPANVSLSMEREIFDRVRFLRGVVWESCHRDNRDYFERLASVVFCSFVDEILWLLRSITLDLSTSQKNQEILSGYLLSFSSFLSILLLKQTVSNLWPSSRRKVHDALEQLLTCTNDCPSGTFKSLVLQFKVQRTKISAPTPFVREPRAVKVARFTATRCREIVLCFALDLARREESVSERSLTSLLNLCSIDSVARNVAHAFQVDSRTVGASVLDEPSTLSSIIDKYMLQLEMEVVDIEIEQRKDCLAKALYYCYETFIIPGLLEGTSTLSGLRLLWRSLELDMLPDESINPKLVCVLLHTLSLILVNNLASHEVNAEELDVTLNCIKAIISLPSRRLESGAFGWLLDWCISVSAEQDGFSSNDDGSLSGYVSYIVAMANFFIASMRVLLDGTRLNDYRKLLRRHNRNRFTMWPDLNERIGDLEKHMDLSPTSTSNFHDKTTSTLRDHKVSDHTCNLARAIISEVQRTMPRPESI